MWECPECGQYSLDWYYCSYCGLGLDRWKEYEKEVVSQRGTRCLKCGMIYYRNEEDGCDSYECPECKLGRKVDEENRKINWGKPVITIGLTEKDVENYKKYIEKRNKIMTEEKKVVRPGSKLKEGTEENQEVKLEAGNGKLCPMLNYIVPSKNPITQQVGIAMQIQPCVGESCIFYKVEYKMCGLLMVIEAVEPEGGEPKKD